MKHHQEIVISLSLFLIVIKEFTATLPLNEPINETQTANNNSTRNLTIQRRDTQLVKEQDPIWFLSLNHILGTTVCILCNILVILGIQSKIPCLILPWLIIYMIGKS